MRSVGRWILGVVVTLFVVTFVILIGVSVAVVQRSPLVVSSAPNQLDGADSVNDLLSQLQNAFTQRSSNHVIHLTETQIESLVGVLQRAVPNFSGVVNVTEVGSTITFTFSPSSVDLYFNVSALILPGDSLQIDYISVGDLSLSGPLMLSFAEKGINYWTKSEIATIALTRVEKVTMRRGEVSLHTAPLASLLEELTVVSNNMGVQEETELQTLAAYYLRYISGRDIALSKQPVPLIEYLREGMARAREQSNSPQQAALHNKAVILALAAYVGHYRIGSLVGDLQPDPTKALKPRAPAILLERNDLARHFIISAALELLAEQDMSWAIGEFKELMDRGTGGSGYSFVDLGADMSGSQFARVATMPEHAESTQNAVARIQSDADIVPAIKAFPEGLSKQAFTEKYGRVDSEAYLNEVAEIKRLIKQVPMYQKAHAERNLINQIEAGDAGEHK
jgi:hypothetical protein